jgi:hypothetical protein
MDEAVRKFLSEIGRKGGKTGKRVLTSADARAMVKVREARKAYHKFYARCFWFCPPDLKITIGDIPWVSEQLMKQGGREGWFVGSKLACR